MKRYAAVLALAAAVLYGPLVLPGLTGTNPTVTILAHLEVSPRPPFVQAAWKVDLGSVQRTVREQAWLVVVNGAGHVSTPGLHVTHLVNACCHTDTVTSWPAQVLWGDCILPAGALVDDRSGAVLVSTVGAWTCWR